MSRSAMTALLSVLAVAGYQNRDKIGELLRGLQNPQGNPNYNPQTGDQGMGGQQQTGGLGGLLGGLTGGGLGGLGGLLSGGSAGGILSGGLGGLLDQFQQNGHGETAKSWVQDGPNAAIDDNQLSQALGPDVLQDLSARTGLSQQELLKRLSHELPAAVDDMTPGGQLPTEDPAENTIASSTRSSVPSVNGLS